MVARSILVLLLSLLCSPCWAEIPGIPHLQDDEFDKRLHGGRVYDLPRVYYHDGAFRDARHDIGPPGIPFSNAAREFPWAKPAGRDQDHTVKVVWPQDVQPRIIPELRLRAPVGWRGRTPTSWGWYRRPAWQWPVGTTFFEVHMHPGGWPFEVRCLTKIEDGYGFDNWDAELFRPFKSRDELPVRVAPVLAQATAKSRHPWNRFEASALVEFYPDVSADWPRQVVHKWPTVTGTTWFHAGRGDGWLSPKNYGGWMHGGSLDGCKKCHQNAGDPVQKFEMFLAERPSLPRDWYGFVPGADGIFTKDPVDRGYVVRDASPGIVRWANN